MMNASRGMEQRLAHMRRSPASRLPNELLSLIFEDTVLEAENLLYRLPRQSEVRGPEYFCKFLTRSLFSLSGVCSRWRVVALTTTRLWTILLTRWREPSEPFFYAHFFLKLRRAGSRRLAIFDSGKFDPMQIHDVLARINVLTRVRKLHIVIENEASVEKLSKVSFPALEELTLEGLGRDEIRLRMFAGVLLHHTTLMSLTLQDIRIRTVPYPYYAEAVTGFISLEKLRTLLLFDMKSYCIDDITRLIYAPNLDTIHLRMNPTNNVSELFMARTDGRYPLEFPSATSRNVRTLVLGGHITCDRLTSILTKLPNLRTLQFTYSTMRSYKLEDTLDVLVKRDGRGYSAFVPYLETIAYHKTRMLRDDLESFVKSRTCGMAPFLKTVQLSKVTLLDYDGRTVTEFLEIPVGVHVEFETWHPSWA